MANGVTTSNLSTSSLVDSLVGEYAGNTVRILTERLVALLMARLGPTYAMRAELFADLDWPDGVVGYVSGDPTADYNGIYRKDGATGAGSWTRVGDLPTSAVEAAQITALSSDLAAEITRAQTAEASKAPLESPAFTGAPTAPDAPADTNSTQIANTSFVHGTVNALISAALDGLNMDIANLDTALAETEQRTGALVNPRDGIAGYAFTISDAAGKVAAGLTDTGAWRVQTLKVSAAAEPSDRDVPVGTPIASDTDGRVAIAVHDDGTAFVHEFDARTLAKISAAVAAQVVPAGQMISGVPGYNHRAYDNSHYLVTMPTICGPVDVEWPKSASGLAWAATTAPIELLSMSGQSNMLDGGDAAHPYGLWNKVTDPHRALMGYPNSWFGDGVGSAAAWTSGTITSFTPAVQNYEYNGVNTISMFPQVLSCISTDQREQRSQRAYVVAGSFEGGTPLSDYLAGTTKGDNIPGYIAEIESVAQASYGRDVIMYAHFLWGHENASYVAPHASYGEMLSAFADEVCGYGAALDANIAAGVRPKVIAYQANSSIDAGVGVVTQSAIDTLHTALTDPDVVCIGPVYHERTVDGGIHMVCKAMTAELMAHVYDLVRSGQDFTPLYISAATISGNVITATLTGPRGFVQADDDWLPTLTNGGIAYTDDSASATVMSVSITNTSDSVRTLTITLNATPIGANKRLIVAGVTNTTDDTHPGGMAAFYVAGPKSAWHRNGFERWTTPEIRFYLCRDVIAVS